MPSTHVPVDDQFPPPLAIVLVAMLPRPQSAPRWFPIQRTRAVRQRESPMSDGGICAPPRRNAPPAQPLHLRVAVLLADAGVKERPVRRCMKQLSNNGRRHVLIAVG